MTERIEDLNPRLFDEAYGEGMLAIAFQILNSLAPSSRRDSYWLTTAPLDAICEILKQSRAAGLFEKKD